MLRYRIPLAFAFALMVVVQSRAGVGDPQLRTDHPWYPGELACSNYERLFATQAELYQRVVGVRPRSDEEKVLAAWLWRNTHYYHAEDGTENLWGKGFTSGDLRTREYWTGLFAHGFGLCGTTHSQWVAEMQQLLGHSRGRGVGVAGHNAFEVFLRGGPYQKGKWVLLDHDLSTVIYDPKGKQLLSLREIQPDWKRLTSRSFLPEKQNGWLVCGLHPGDGSSYQQYKVAEYLAGYSGVPPMVDLRRGERLRRYLEPGLDDGKTFVFWGRNYNAQGIPGPERSRTWVNQPEKMYRSKTGTGHQPGQARYGNAVYSYEPDFVSGDYREAVVEESDAHITFAFRTPYIIGATPPNAKPWGIYDKGCRNGLRLMGDAKCAVSVSVDRGRTWTQCGEFRDGMDLTDHVKGHRQYFLRLHTNAQELAKSKLVIRTVCQANAAILPRLRDGKTEITFAASKRGVVSVGPTLEQAKTHLVEGAFGTPRATLAVATPRAEPIVKLYATAHMQSSNPPRPDVKYQIEYSTDEGKTWASLVKDWHIPRRGDEPGDFWSQSFCWGECDIEASNVHRVRVRFRNDGGKRIARCEVHAVYRLPVTDTTEVTFDWTNAKGPQRASHRFVDSPKARTWVLPTGEAVRTRWVEMAPIASPRQRTKN